MKYLILLAFLVSSIVVLGQGFKNTDSLRTYNSTYTNNSALLWFTNLRGQTLLRGIIDHIDSARLGVGSANLGIDSLFALNDSTVRYKYKGVFYNFSLKGIYEARRKVDTAYAVNDTTIRTKINGTTRDVTIRGIPNYITKRLAYSDAKAITPSTGEHYTVAINNVYGNFLYDASDTTSTDDSAMVIVTSGSKRLKRIVPNETLDVRWFGAKGDGVADDWYALQKAINHAIYNNYKKVFIPGGIYNISKGLVVWKDANNDSIPEFVNISIEGNIVANDGVAQNGSTLKVTSSDNFGLAIVLGKGSSVKNLNIIGTNVLNYSNATAWNPSTTYLQGSQRTNRYSPYAGLVIDPFRGGQSVSGDKYPGFTAYYKSTDWGNSGSTDCKFENLVIDGFVVGIVLSPNGRTQNNEAHLFDGLWFTNCREGFVTCNSQERQVVVRNVKAWESVKTVFATEIYGAQIGTCPDIDGINVAGNIYQVFDVNSRSNVNIKNVYAESFYRIGTVAGFNATITDSYFDLGRPSDYGLKFQDWILNANSRNHLAVMNSTIFYYDGGYNTPLNILGRVKFSNCELNNLAGNYYNQLTIDNTNLMYENCSFYTRNATIRDDYKHSVFANILMTSGFYLKPGQAFSPYARTDYDEFAMQTRRVTSPLRKIYSLGNVNVTVSGSTATAVIPKLAKQSGLVGELMCEPNQDYARGNQLMRIASINDTGLVTFDRVVNSMTSGVHYNMYVEVMQSFDGLILFDYNASGSPKVTNVFAEGSSSAATLTKNKTYWFNRAPVSFDSVGAGYALPNSTITDFGYNPLIKRGILSNYTYEESGLSYGNPLNNGFFNNGVLFTAGAVYKNTKYTDADSNIVEFKCTVSGVKGSSSPPEFETIYKYNRKMDSAWVVNDTTVRYTINGTQRDLTIKGKGGSTVTEGTWTPTISDTSNLSSNPGFTTPHYYRIGNSVTVWGTVTVEPRTTGISYFKFTLPVATTSAVGAGAANSLDKQQGATIGVDSNNGKGVFQLYANETTNQNFYYHFSYYVQ